MDTTEFWKKEAHLHIMPNTGQEFPEGWDVRLYLEELCYGKSITEIGCGIGRLSAAFQPEHYVGIDISPGVLEIAKSKNEHPDAEVRLLYTVLLHIDDDCIDGLVENLCKNTERVIVAEIMGRQWRRPGNPPVFNREADEYISIFEKCGFELAINTEKVYERYANTNITFLHFKKRIK